MTPAQEGAWFAFFDLLVAAGREAKFSIGDREPTSDSAAIEEPARR